MIRPVVGSKILVHGEYIGVVFYDDGSSDYSNPLWYVFLCTGGSGVRLSCCNPCDTKVLGDCGPLEELPDGGYDDEHPVVLLLRMHYSGRKLPAEELSKDYIERYRKGYQA